MFRNVYQCLAGTFSNIQECPATFSRNGQLEGCGESQTESTGVHQSLYFYVLPRTTNSISSTLSSTQIPSREQRATRRQSSTPGRYAIHRSAAQGLSSEHLRLRHLQLQLSRVQQPALTGGGEVEQPQTLLQLLTACPSKNHGQLKSMEETGGRVGGGVGAGTGEFQ